MFRTRIQPGQIRGDRPILTPIQITDFHRLELRNALSLAVFQQRLTSAQGEAAWTQVQEDLEAGVLVARRIFGPG